MDNGHKILVYMGGNNHTYFSEALPAALAWIQGLHEQNKLCDVMIVLQQRPGAKTQNRDGALVTQLAKHGPEMVFSAMETEQALVLADAVAYSQTSMGPQFALAGLPTMQIGHEPYPDILVLNHLCGVISSQEMLLDAIEALKTDDMHISADGV